MTIELYHCNDARSLRPLWALEELGVDYQLTNLEFPPRYKHKAFLEINKLGTVPALRIDGTTMTESSAMTVYLAEKFNAKQLLINNTDVDYANYLNWLYRSDATLTFPLSLVLRYRFFEKNDESMQKVANDYEKWFLNRAICIEDALDSSDYLVGNRFTIVDICVGYAVILADKLKLTNKLGPKTQAYLTRLTQREGYQRAIQKQGLGQINL